MKRRRLWRACRGCTCTSNEMKQFPPNHDPRQHIYYTLYSIKHYREYFVKHTSLLLEELETYENSLRHVASFEEGQRFNWRTDLGASLEVVFPQIHRRATFVMLFGFLEHRLNELSDLYMFKNSLPLRFKDLKGRGIDRAKEYLSKVVGLQMDASEQWTRIKHFQKIRNIIVHGNAEVEDPNDQRLQGFLKKDLIVLNKHLTYEISLNEDFVMEFFEILEKYFNELSLVA